MKERTAGELKNVMHKSGGDFISYMDERRKEAQSLKPIMAIGKAGITEASAALLKKEVKQKGLVRVKFLKSFLTSTDRKEAARNLAEAAGVELVQQVGGVACYARIRSATNEHDE